MVALVEQQVERALHGRQRARRTRRRRDRTDRFAPASAFLPREMRFSIAARPVEKRARDLARAEAAEDVEHERDLRVLRAAADGSTRTSSAAARRGSPARERLVDGGASVHSDSSRRASSGANVRAVRSRRTTSSARCFAVAISHADGLSGTPRNFHTSSARQKASCTTSSASARLCTPKMRVSAATRRPDSRRNRCSAKLHYMIHLHHGPDFDRAAAVEDRAAARQLHRLIEVARLDDREAADQVLGLRVRPVGDGFCCPAHDLARRDRAAGPGPSSGLSRRARCIQAIHRCMLCCACSGVPIACCRGRRSFDRDRETGSSVCSLGCAPFISVLQLYDVREPPESDNFL